MKLLGISFGCSIVALALGPAAFAQSLSLSSATAAPGATVALSLSVSSPAGGEPSALQWTFSYPSASIASIAVSAGAAATAAGKSVSCAGGPTAYTCVLSGDNTNVIANGIVAAVTAALTSSAATASVGIGASLGANTAGSAVTIAATGGVITIPTTSPTLTSLVCTPASLSPGLSSSCTVAMSAAVSSPTVVALTSSSSALTIPASVTIPAGAATAGFTAAAGAFASDQSATVAAALNGASATASIALAAPPLVTALRCSASTLTSNASASCTVTLSKAAASAGATVALKDDAAALTVPASVTVPAGAMSAAFTAATAAVTSSQTATITAALNGSSQAAAISLVASPTLASLQCASSRVAPSSTVSCSVVLAQAAPSGGLAVTLSANSAVLAVPPSITVPAGAASASFTVAAGAFSTNQTASISAVVGAATVSTTVYLALPSTVTPNTRFLLTGDASELSGAANGATVTPAVAPVGMTGNLVANGAGSVNFVPGSGAYFLNCCSNTNNAYYKFTGTAVGNIFNAPQGQVSFTLKSRYSFAQRLAAAASPRYTFDVRDANGHQFYFLTQIVSGSLVLNYMAGGAGQYYYVPAGQEDQLFGSGVSLDVAMQWDGAAITLLLNGQIVKSTSYLPAAQNWTSASNFDFGAYEYQIFGGYNSSDDVIGNFAVSIPGLLQIRGDQTEVSAATNGSKVTPASAPAGFTGHIVVNGSGAATFTHGSGVSFQTCCWNMNTAYYKFTGSSVGTVFGVSQGQISFTLKSRYSFVQRRTAAASPRYAFDVRDANGHQLYFLTQIVSGALVFSYMAGGAGQYYFVPAGQEDLLFGRGVSLNVAIKWDGAAITLFLNGQAVKSTPYVPAAQNWTSASNFDLGAYEYQTFGGYNVLDDSIRDFTVSGK